MADVSPPSLRFSRLSSSLLNSFSASFISYQWSLIPTPKPKKNIRSYSICGSVHPVFNFNPRFSAFRVNAVVSTETNQPKWWEKNAGPNMMDIHSTQELLTAFSQAGERLVIVEFYGTWCASCRALFPKLCRIAVDHPEIVFLKVNFDENKRMCKNLNVRVLPFFHFYRGADGQLESFSCSLAKLQKIKDAIEIHNTDRCSIGPPIGLGNLHLESSASGNLNKPGSSSSSSS